VRHEQPDARQPVERRDPLEEALSRCYRHLGERDHSTAELRRRLLRARLPQDAVERALEAVIEQGYLDDARYTRLLVEDRRRIDGWGSQRIRARLEAAGIARELIDEALADADGACELVAATALLERRCPGPYRDDRERQRAFGVLIRMGYDLDVAYDAIRASSASETHSASWSD
jgi:regulatory protein